MRFGVILIIGLFIGAFCAHFLLEDRGYVLIRLMGHSVQTSVPVLVLALLALYVITRMVIRILAVPRAIGGAIGARERAMAQGALTRGLAEISAGNLTRGERILTRQAVRGDAPVLAYLGAARAAQLQGATARRDGWLKRAREHAPGDVPAVLITQAELEIADGQLDDALATLRRLEAMRPKHAQCLALQARIYEEREDWDSLAELLPRLRREKALSSEGLQRIERRLASETLRIGADQNNRAELRQAWKQLGSRKQQTDTLTREYVSALIRAGDHAEAASTLRKRLREQWDPELLYLVGKLSGEQQRKLQPQLTAWRRKRPDDPALLYASAAVGAGNDPQTAIERLESSLDGAPRMEAFELYGRLLNQQGRYEDATRAFRSALSCTAEGREQGHPLLERLTPEAELDAVAAAPLDDTAADPPGDSTDGTPDDAEPTAAAPAAQRKKKARTKTSRSPNRKRRRAS
jgi:HemY protein